jgi:PHD-finger
MASQSGMFLNREERASLVRELKSKGELKPGMVPKSLLEEAENLQDEPPPHQNSSTHAVAFGTGCLACGQDDDHAHLLLCEGCNDEYHTYCLDPPLTAVPTDDWFCSE